MNAHEIVATATRLLVERLRNEVVVSNLGQATLDLQRLGDRPLNCYTFGSMGQCSSIGLGIALARPDVRVVCLDGDGSLLMNLGSLCTIATLAPRNYALVIWDNEVHMTTGGQPTATAFRSSLAALARGECDLAGFHVADALPRAAAAAAALGRWLDPRKHQLVHFVTREQGIIVRPGARVRGVRDLARPGIRFMNRPPGAGPHDNVDLAVAAAVAEGRADAGFGLRAAAAHYALEFVPLATERYYLAAQRRTFREAPLQVLLDAMRSRAFVQSTMQLPGYDASTAGAREALGAALAWLARPRPRKRPG